MDILYIFIIYAIFFRIAIIIAGVVIIVLGYRLFCKGIWPDNNASVNAKVGISCFTLKNAAPGTLFALFGVSIIITMLVNGSPEMVLKTLKSNNATSVSIELKGLKRGEAISTATQKGLQYAISNDIENAIAAYEEAVGIMATPLNNLAWLYQLQGKQEEALNLSKIAVQISPYNADVWDTLGEIFKKMGQSSEALKIMEKAAKLNPKYEKKLEKYKKSIK